MLSFLTQINSLLSLCLYELLKYQKLVAENIFNYFNVPSIVLCYISETLSLLTLVNTVKGYPHWMCMHYVVDMAQFFPYASDRSILF